MNQVVFTQIASMDTRAPTPGALARDFYRNQKSIFQLRAYFCTKVASSVSNLPYHVDPEDNSRISGYGMYHNVRVLF